MAIRLKFGNDLNISGSSRGAGSFISTPPVGGACPPAGYSGTTLTGIEYPIAQGGAYFNNPINGGAELSQICDVPVYNDGSCGTYNDWASVANIAYKAYGTQFYVNDVNQPTAVTTAEVPAGSGNFVPDGYVDIGYNHDGAGSYYSEEVNFNYFNSGDYTGVSHNEEAEVPSGGSAYQTGRYQNYLWDGSGGHYLFAVYYGSYHPAGQLVWENATGSGGASIEVPSGSGNYFDQSLTGDRYEWDGSGGYNSFSSWYYASGTYITVDGTDAYYWDGSGSYYSQNL